MSSIDPSPDPRLQADSHADDGTLAPDTHWRGIPRRTLTIALSVLPVVALVNVGVLIWSLDGINLSERIARPGLLVLVAVLVFAPMMLNSLRLAIWGRFLGLSLRFSGALKVVTGTMIANSVTPSATGSVPIRMLFLMGEGISSRRALTLISFQAAEDTLVMVTLVGLFAGFSGFAMFEFLANDPALAARFAGSVGTAMTIAVWVLGGVLLTIGAIATGLLGQRVRGFAARMIARARHYLAQIVGDWRAVLERGKGVALINLTIAAAQWLVRFSIAGIILAAFGVEWNAALYWLLQYLVQAISSIVPTPGGVGGAEAGFLFLFSPFVGMETALLAMPTWRLMFFYLPLVGAALIFFLLTRRARAKAQRARAQQREGREALSIPPGEAAAHPAE